MEELVKLITSKTGISDEQARGAIEVVINFLKQRLPEPIAAQLDGILKGGGDIGGIAKSVGGLFGL
jgi:hypothetical protein